MKKVLLSAVLFGLTAGSYAQDAKPAKEPSLHRESSITIGVGTTVGFTDVKQNSILPVTSYKNEIGFAVSGSYEKYINAVFGLQGQLNWAQVKGTDRARTLFISTPIKGIYSVTNTIETSVNGIINLSNIGVPTSATPKKFLVYATMGMGFGFYRSAIGALPSDDSFYGSGSLNRDGYLLVKKESPGYTNAKTKEETGRANELFIPLGLGVKYKLNTNIDLGLEVTSRQYMTDKLDALVANGNYDSYLQSMVTLSYKLGSQEDAIIWSDPMSAILASVESNTRKVNAITSDSDKDGVADMFDKEPGTAEGAIVDGAGRTIDLNGSKISALEERVAVIESRSSENASAIAGVKGAASTKAATSPTTTGTPAKGAAAVKAVANTNAVGFTGSYLPSVYFSTNGSSLDTRGEASIAEIAKAIKGNNAITVVGNADRTGSESANTKLAEKRAQAVVNVLVKKYGFDKGAFTIISNGANAPIGTAKFANRRVDVLVK